MIVVSDTSPLNYLVLIREERVLPLLFSRVVVPRSVLAEMSHAATPEPVRAWVASLPSWVELRSPAVPPARLGDLGPGELDAIAIAEDLRADALLIDERDGRRVARERGIATYGTVAVLEAAAARGLLVLAHAFVSLGATNFRVDKSLLQDALARDAERRQDTDKKAR